MQRQVNNYKQLSFLSTIGQLRIVAGEAGIVEIILPDCPSRLSFSSLSDDVPEVRGLLQQAKEQIDQYLKGARRNFTLPFYLQATFFQMAVWREIRSIPYGITKTYGEVGCLLGGGGKARAVGNAAGANPLPFLIPCHRVVGASGKLGGFSGGVSLKAYLLAMEKNNTRSHGV